MDYQESLMAPAPSAGGQGLQLNTGKLATSHVDPWGLMAMIDQSQVMQQSFGAPMAPNAGPQQPQAGGSQFGKLLGMMGGNPGIFSPQAGGVAHGRGGGFGSGGGRAQAPQYLPPFAPQRPRPPSIGMLLGGR